MVRRLATQLGPARRIDLSDLSVGCPASGNDRVRSANVGDIHVRTNPLSDGRQELWTNACEHPFKFGGIVLTPQWVHRQDDLWPLVTLHNADRRLGPEQPAGIVVVEKRRGRMVHYIEVGQQLRSPVGEGERL